jgi:hypothetical protein
MPLLHATAVHRPDAVPAVVAAMGLRSPAVINRTCDEAHGSTMRRGATALHVACAVRAGAAAAVRALLSVPGIDLNIRDCDGNTPLGVVIERIMQDVDGHGIGILVDILGMLSLRGIATLVARS